MSAAMFGFVTGLHLALLQFSSFFVLLINVSSTYVTYVVNTSAWMLGALAGLLWRGLHPGVALLLGTVGYYGVYALVLADPLGPYTLPLAAVGVAASGLWGGLFFTFMLPRTAHVDRLLLNENNGFLVGLVLVFVGFTMLGRMFLLVAPLVSLAWLFVHLRRLRRWGETRQAEA